jgi:hypothetical protein
LSVTAMRMVKSASRGSGIQIFLPSDEEQYVTERRSHKKSYASLYYYYHG